MHQCQRNGVIDEKQTKKKKKREKGNRLFLNVRRSFVCSILSGPWTRTQSEVLRGAHLRYAPGHLVVFPHPPVVADGGDDTDGFLVHGGRFHFAADSETAGPDQGWRCTDRARVNGVGFKDVWAGLSPPTELGHGDRLLPAHSHPGATRPGPGAGPAPSSPSPHLCVESHWTQHEVSSTTLIHP